MTGVATAAVRITVRREDNHVGLVQAMGEKSPRVVQGIIPVGGPTAGRSIDCGSQKTDITGKSLDDRRLLIEINHGYLRRSSGKECIHELNEGRFHLAELCAIDAS